MTPCSRIARGSAAPRRPPRLRPRSRLGLCRSAPPPAVDAAPASNHLVAQRHFAAPEAPQIVAQNLDQIVFVTARLTCRVGGEKHMLHSPKRRVWRQRLLRRHVDAGPGDAP